MTGPVLGATVVVIFLLVAGVALDRIALHLIRPPLKPLRQRAEDLPFTASRVAIPSGAHALSGWVVSPTADNGGPVLVLVHGWGSNHGTMARLARPMLTLGYPVLLFDIRHHGESKGAPYVTARHFRDDILAAVRAAGDGFPGRSLVLVGHSMGGSMGILAVADGAPVEGLVSIGAPADLWEVWAYHLNGIGIPGGWAVKVLRPFWRLRAGVPWSALDPRARAGEIRIPFLVLHGEADESVPAGHARLLAAAGGVKARLLQGQGHTDLLESPEVHREVVKFLDAL